MTETTVPRLLALVLLLGSLAMLVPLVRAVMAMAREEAVPVTAWAVPLVILATGSALSYVLSRRGVGLQLFIPAMALWLLAAGYFLFLFLF